MGTRVIRHREESIRREFWCCLHECAVEHIIQYHHVESFGKEKEKIVFFYAACLECVKDEAAKASRYKRPMRPVARYVTHALDRWNALISNL